MSNRRLLAAYVTVKYMWVPIIVLTEALGTCEARSDKLVRGGTRADACTVLLMLIVVRP
jgi:hypothetical protein